MDKLSQKQKHLLHERIRTLDPQSELVTLMPNDTYTSGTITYNPNSGIVLHEHTKRITDEEYVRAYLVVHLVKQLRYPADSLELEKTYTIGRPSPTRAQIDIKVWDKRAGKKSAAFMLVEVKRPDEFATYTKLIEDQLFATGNQEYSSGVRYVAWYSIEFTGDEFRDKCIVIDFRKHHDYHAWVEAGEPGHNLDLPLEYGVVRKHRYVKGETPLDVEVSRGELETLRRDFHNVLWGGAKMGDTDVFNNLLKMFLAKIYDEQTTIEGQAYRFQIELKDGEPESPAEVVAKINRLYQDALKHYFGYSEATVRAATINENRFPPNKVTYVVERLEGISIVENTYEDDVLGAFFESIIRTGFKQDKGQFFTHVNIVRFVLYALEVDTWAIDQINNSSPRTLPYIIDPACGSGTFLLEAMKIITQSVVYTNSGKLHHSNAVRDYVDEFFRPGSANKHAHNRWARTFLFGIDDNEDLATATKVNMILHGDGSANIFKADGLANFSKYQPAQLQTSQAHPNTPYKSPVNEQFDGVVSNPPFSLKEETRTLHEYSTRFAYAGQKNSENLFLERWYQLLKEGGRMGVVLPDSVFDTNENMYIRMFLYRFFWIRAVVSLGQVAFQPYTPTKTSLLFAVKKSRQQVEAWDAAWRQAASEYAKLRRSPLVQSVLLNERLRNILIDLASRAEIEWYPAENMLTATTLPTEIRQQLIAAFDSASSSGKRLDTALKELDEVLKQNLLSSLTSTALQEAIETARRLLRDRQPPDAATLTLPQLVEAAYDDLLQAADLNYTEDPKGQPYCNAWWVFAEVTTQPPFDYEIFFAEAEQVGYKRSVRHPEGMPQPNDLFQTDADGNIVIDTENPKTILDHLRSKRVFFCPDVTLEEAADVHIYHRYARDIAASFGLRFSYRFLHPKFELLERHYLRALRTLRLATLCARPIMRGVQPLYDESDIRVVKIANMRNGYMDWSDAQTVDEDFYRMHVRRAGVQDGDVIISSSGTGSLGKVDFYDETTSALAAADISIVRINPELFNPNLLAYILRSRIAQWQIDRLLAGATNQIHIYSDQIAALRLPELDYQKQIELIHQIEILESNISAARVRLRQPGDVINDILCQAFKYPLAEHKARERERSFTRRLSQFSEGFTLRGSVKFYHPNYELTDAFFARTPHKRVKAYLAVPIRLGVSLLREAMDEDGEAFYVHPGAVRYEGQITPADCHPISQDFYEKNQRRAALKIHDVVIARSGEGTIGKVGLLVLDEACIFSDFTMRLRFNATLNPQFAWYYFRSIMFQAQIEREKRGMGNMTNIFPSQVEQLLVVECSREQQDALAEQISAELAAVEYERQHIEARRKEIDLLIESALQPG